METRRNDTAVRSEWTATIRLAIVVSLIGVTVAVAVERVGVLPHQLVVFGVIGIGFVASWIHSGRRSPTRAI